jgi:hypothetical protein
MAGEFMALSVRERQWCLVVVPLLVLVKLALSLLSFSTCLRLARLHYGESTERPITEQKVATALALGHVIAGVGRRLPFAANCLVQSLGTMLMLRFYGIPAILYVGTRLDDHGFSAHAWVGAGSRIVNGGDGSESFAIMANIAMR